MINILKRRYWVGMGIGILIIGIAATITAVKYTDTALRTSLKDRAQTIAAGVHDNVLKMLTGSPTDIGSDSYRDIKQSMINIRSVNPDSRFVYIMGLRDGQLFFYGDSEQPDSKDYSAPGDLYQDASEFKLQHIHAGDAFTEGPYKDIWGTWISGYAPIFDTDTPVIDGKGKVLATVGIDISVTAWREQLVYAGALPVTIMIALELILFFYHRSRLREQAVDQMKSEFISLASHQLRTPLTAMKWFSQLLLMKDVDKLTAEQKEYITNIKISNERMIDLVNALLNISRMESGRIIVEPVATKLSELVQGVLDEVKLKADEKNQEIKVELDKNLPVISLDPKLIRQVYLNFLTNAIKYTPEKGIITITVSVNGSEVVSKVIDTGYGVPAKDKVRVFQKFYRGDNIVKLGADGTGLGLYLVKAIVESSGGIVGFETEEGKGSTFWFKLPLSGSQAKKGEVTLS